MDQTMLTNYLNSLKKLGIPGCDCVVYHKRKPVFRHVSGFADYAKTKPLTKTNTYWLYSASKIITCVAVMQLVEKGSICLDEPVSEYLPEYKNLKVRHGSVIEQAKNKMTIRHLLSMQSGMNYNLKAPSIIKVLNESKGQASTRQIVEALADEPLDFEPGTHFQYSLSHDVLGAVIEVVTCQQLGGYLHKKIFKPLGMKNTGFELTHERKSKMSDQFLFNMNTMSSELMSFENCYVLSPKYESAGAGLISTVDDYIIFLNAMCNYGISNDGYCLLSKESIDEMRSDQLHDISKKDFDLRGKIGYSYGLGVRTLLEREKSGARSPIGEFGWDSAAGAYALIDVENSLAVFYIQHVRKCDYAYNVIHPHIRNLTYDMLKL